MAGSKDSALDSTLEIEVRGTALSVIVSPEHSVPCEVDSTRTPSLTRNENAQFRANGHRRRVLRGGGAFSTRVCRVHYPAKHTGHRHLGFERGCDEERRYSGEDLPGFTTGLDDEP